MAQQEDRLELTDQSGFAPVTESEENRKSGDQSPASVAASSGAVGDVPGSGQSLPTESDEQSVVPADEPTMVRVVLDKLLSLMGVKGKVEVEKQADGSYYCNIHTRQASGLLIGHRGSTLRALQYLVHTIVSQRFPDLAPVTVDVGGYRVRRENFLCKKAIAVARIVLETKREMALDMLTTKELEAVEQVLRSIPGVRAYALGTGHRRNVVIAPKQE